MWFARDVRWLMCCFSTSLILEIYILKSIIIKGIKKLLLLYFVVWDGSDLLLKCCFLELCVLVCAVALLSRQPFICLIPWGGLAQSIIFLKTTVLSGPFAGLSCLDIDMFYPPLTCNVQGTILDKETVFIQLAEHEPCQLVVVNIINPDSWQPIPNPHHHTFTTMAYTYALYL